MADFKRFSEELLAWYDEHKRVLPWRGETDAYKIWVSEIILQQTRVAQGWNYYLHFIERFPTVFSLAEAPQEAVLKVWQGLGYYSRARNMQTAAQTIVREYDGQLPSDYAQLLKLKGIGEYTAAAIASLAFSLPFPAVDGNVFRVICRVFGIFDDIGRQTTKKLVTDKCRALMPADRPGDFNQAMMDFGSLQCTSMSPDCVTCPFSQWCFAYRNEKVDDLPVIAKKQQVKKRYFHYFCFTDGVDTILKQRGPKDIWQGLFEFPMVETIDNQVNVFECLSTFRIENCENVEKMYSVKHLLSHQTVFADFYVIKVDSLPILQEGMVRVECSRLNRYPMMKIMADFVESFLESAK